MPVSMLTVYRSASPRRDGGRGRDVNAVDPFDLRALPALYHIAGNRRALGQREQAGPSYRRYVAKEVAQAVGGRQEAVPLYWIVRLHRRNNRSAGRSSRTAFRHRRPSAAVDCRAESVISSAISAELAAGQPPLYPRPGLGDRFRARLVSCPEPQRMTVQRRPSAVGLPRRRARRSPLGYRTVSGCAVGYEKVRSFGEVGARWKEGDAGRDAGRGRASQRRWCRTPHLHTDMGRAQGGPHAPTLASRP